MSLENVLLERMFLYLINYPKTNSTLFFFCFWFLIMGNKDCILKFIK